MKSAVRLIRRIAERVFFPSLGTLRKEAKQARATHETLLKRVVALEAANKKLLSDGQKSTDRLTAVIDLLGPLYADNDALAPDMTPQERAWFGKHGFRYIIHHMGENWEQTRVPFWTEIFSILPAVTSVCEFGANIGANLKAIRSIKPETDLAGIEVNPVACNILTQEGFHATQGSIAEVELGRKFDLVFSRGVLIHIKPSDLTDVMRRMANHSSRYVMIFEHYSQTMHSLDAYGKAVARTTGEVGEGYQFWGDFSGEFAKLYPDWSITRSGVRNVPDVAPKYGDLHWTIFQKPSHPATSDSPG